MDRSLYVGLGPEKIYDLSKFNNPIFSIDHKISKFFSSFQQKIKFSEIKLNVNPQLSIHFTYKKYWKWGLTQGEFIRNINFSDFIMQKINFQDVTISAYQ
ncbi:MAG: hypothetical protein LW832_02235 [Parachlamydia sp.]|jgi:hypothetical protein|nr:hypothetical protein [Parachlamydia sp.]